MGSPISGTAAEIFLQHIENTYIKHLVDTKNIICYTRYVDNILIIYNTRYINANTIHEYINQIHTNLQLNSTQKYNGHVNFLDLLIIRSTFNLEKDIHRKPTTTNTAINYTSNHPTEHQIPAYRYHITRMQSLPLTTERQQPEWKKIKSIAQSNNFPDTIITELKSQLQQKTHQTHDNEENKNKKWAVFTYYSPRIRKLTNLFKHTDIGIAFRSTNSIQQLTKPKTPNHTQEHNRSGIYKLTCNTCKLSYIGQTSRKLKQRYQEHIRYIGNNDPQSAYVQHILKNQHKYGPFTDTMTLLKSEQNSSELIPYEQLYILTYHQNRHYRTKCRRPQPPTPFGH
jgi:hypothetical protein